MADLWLPPSIPPVYRGGRSLTVRPHDVKLSRRTGLLRITHGISVDADANHVASFGGAYLVRGIPELLTIWQRGQRASHFEIVPFVPMVPEEYPSLLNQVELELHGEEG